MKCIATLAEINKILRKLTKQLNNAIAGDHRCSALLSVR
jgi:hypothetical protein